MSFSDAWEKMILSHRFNIQNYATSELWVGLSSDDPLDDASGVSEPSGKGYTRVKTNVGSGTSWQISDSSGVTVSNTSGVTFPTASDVWGTMAYGVLFSGSTSGASVLVSGALSSSQVVSNGEVARFIAGQLQFCLK